MTKKRRGRPEIDPSERRSIAVSFFVTEAEAQALQALAEEAGLARSEYCRRKVLGKLRRK